MAIASKGLTQKETEFLKFQKQRGFDAKASFIKLNKARSAGLFDITEQVEITETPTVEGPTIGEQVGEGIEAIGKPVLEAAEVAGEALKGAGKGALKTLTGAAELGQTAFEETIGRIPELFGGEQVKGVTEPEEFITGVGGEQILTPVGTAQEVGFTAEQLGEFFIPGFSAGKLPKAGTKSAALFNLIKKSLAEGGQAGVIKAAQEGEFGEEAVIAATTGVLAPIAIAPITKGLKGLGEFAFSSTIPSTITQKGKDLVKNLGIGEAVGTTGISLTRKGLVKSIEKNISKLGKELGKNIDEATAAKPFAGSTISEISKGIKDKILTDPTIKKRLQATPLELVQIENKIDEVLDGYAELVKTGKLPQRLTVKDLQQLKTDLGTGLKNTFDKSVDAAIKAQDLVETQLRQNVRKIIEKEVPITAELNKKLAPLLEADARLRKKGGYSGYLTDLVIGGAFAGSQGDILSNPTEFIKDFAKGVVIKRLGTSTAAKTTAGAVTNNVGKLLDNPGVAQSVREMIETIRKDLPDNK